MSLVLVLNPKKEERDKLKLANEKIPTWKAPWLASTSPNRKLIPSVLYFSATSRYFGLKESTTSLLKFRNNIAYKIPKPNPYQNIIYGMDSVKVKLWGDLKQKRDYNQGDY